MPNILLTWELGGGMGHVTPSVGLVRRLIDGGADVHVAAKDLGPAARAFDGLDVRFWQAPSNMVPRRRPVAPVRAFGHLLHNIGFADPIELHAHALAWRAILDAAAPDALVLDHSPTALLAARGLPVRRIVYGNGFCCPPPCGSWPDLRPWLPAPFENNDDDLLATMNAVLDRMDAPPLDRASRLYESDAHALTTFEAFDPYAPRADAVDYFGPAPPSGGRSPQWPSSPGARVFAYFNPFRGLPIVLDLLARSGLPTIACVNRLDDRLRRDFTTPMLTITDEHHDLRLVAETCDLAVLHGGHATTLAFLLSGVPCLFVPSNLEQGLTGEKVAALGAGQCLAQKDLHAFPAALAAMIGDNAYRAAARAFADQHAAFDPTASLDRAARVILGR